MINTKTLNSLFHLLCLVVVLVLFSTDCLAAEGGESGGDVFGRMERLGLSLGRGMLKSGYLIAGLGLAACSVAAIFGKVNWTTLSYIMIAVFIIAITISGALYNAAGYRGSLGPGNLSYGDNWTAPQENVQGNPVKK